MKTTMLRILLIWDAAVLFLLGGAFMCLSGRMLIAFGFHNVPSGVDFIVGVFGVVYATMGIGYLLAAYQPLRNIVWIQVAIVRGLLECLYSLLCVAQGIIPLRYASFSIVVPTLISIGCILLYPRPGLPSSSVVPNTAEPS